MPLPFLGRLNITEYVALVGSFFLVGLETLIRILTLALPSPLINIFYRASRRGFNKFRTAEEKKAEEKKKDIHTSIRNASDFVDMCAMYGYTAEEHVVQTKDGYLLGVHRLAWKKGEEDMRVNAGPNSIQKRVAYLHHGLLMNSEVWVCLTDAQRCLPFVLLERGFDVWLGNNRGNKYSKKSVKYPPTSTEFWNFSIDDFAFHDIPDSIEYILHYTQQPSLSYIGFSQGTAQAFASLAVHPKLNDQVNVFIALAPAMSPAGLSNGIVDALIKASPQVLFLLFGRRSILSAATMWQNILYPPLFVRLIDMGLSFLFNWNATNISVSQKLAAYPHLYSFTSTKSVVHWFQIIRNKAFQMYDDDVQSPLSVSTSSKYTKVAKYPTRNIRTPVVLVYGGSDSLVDIKVMLKELPRRTVATVIPHYEHLDFLWARDVDAQVFPHVFDALDSFTDAAHSKQEYESYHQARYLSLSASNTFRHRYRDSDVTIDSDSASIRDYGGVNGNNAAMQHQAREGGISPMTDSATESTLGTSDMEHHTRYRPRLHKQSESFEAEPNSSGADNGQNPSPGVPAAVEEPAVTIATMVSPSSTKKVGGNNKVRRRSSNGSFLSIDSIREGSRGIKIGAGRPATGVVTGGINMAPGDR